jgi:hypothetical protein
VSLRALSFLCWETRSLTLVDFILRFCVSATFTYYLSLDFTCRRLQSYCTVLHAQIGPRCRQLRQATFAPISNPYRYPSISTIHPSTQLQLPSLLHPLGVDQGRSPCSTSQCPSSGSQDGVLAIEATDGDYSGFGCFKQGWRG